MTPSAGPGVTGDRGRFEAAIRVANVPTLLMVLVQLTGDLGWLRDPYLPVRARGPADDDTGGLEPGPLETVRAAVLEAILAWRAGRPAAIPDPPDELVATMLSASAGEAVPAEYGPMFADILGCRAAPPPDPGRHAPPPEDFRVLIVGAGLSGIAAAVRMQEMGVEFQIVERRSDLGGTWVDNDYPGAAVDVPSHLYSYSFAANDWPHHFARRRDVHAYIAGVANKFDVTRHISFSTDVVAATYDADAHLWRVQLRRPDGTRTETAVNVLISAVGAFSAPIKPAIPGLDDFTGDCFHTARWPKDLELSGRRVGVIGNGASAMQVVPAIAPAVEQLHVFQRSPQWMQPLGTMADPIPDELRFLMNEVELYQRWYKTRWAWIFHDKLHASLQKDPAWPYPDRSLNAANDAHRKYFTKYLNRQLEDHPDLLRVCVPDYPPFGKRMLYDWGWFDALKRDNVHLFTDGISEIREDRIVTFDGTEHEVDTIVLATGFDVVRFISSFEVVGRSGVSLKHAWDDDDGRAYLGLAVPDFPNFFCVFGPNTQPGHGGSLIHTVEAQIHYISDLLAQMFRRDLGSVECRSEVFDEYNNRVDAAHAGMVWTHPGMTTYYRNSRGRVVVNMPFRNLDFWEMTRAADLDEFVIEPGRVGRVGLAPRGREELRHRRVHR